GGYVRLVEAMARGLDLRLGEVVERVAYDADGVEVTTASGRSYRGSHALVTLPLGCLKAGSVEFSPELPAEKRDPIRRAGFGNFEKVAMRFREAFWLAERDHFLFLSEERLEYPIWLDLTRLVGEPTLILLSGGSFARKVAGFSTAEVEARTQAILRELFGASIPEPTFLQRTDWANDPFTRGAYSYIHRSQLPEDQ